MRRSSPPRGGCGRAGAIVVLATLASGCGHWGAEGGERLAGEAACRTVDSTLSQAGPRGEMAMHGRATIDVAQYRVNGRFTLAVTAAGDATFEFGGSSLLGGHREDVVVSLWGDTLRILDRERGRYYEGEDAVTMVEDGLGVEGDVATALRRALGWGPPCAAIGSLERDGTTLSGSVPGGTFRLELSDGRLDRAVWPDPFATASRRDRLEVTYQWSGPELERLTVLLPGRRWRVRLVAE